MKLYKSLLVLVVPISIQNLLTALVNSVDIFMLGYVGQNELSAVSLANQYMFILWGFFFGINSASTLMNSQYWGKGDLKAIQAVLMTLYTNDAVLIDIGVDYLRTIGISYLIMAFSQCYQCLLRSVEQAKV